MSLKNVDIESALRRLADRRIEEAMREGKFDNLPGAGKLIDLEPMPADENARLAWWAIRLLKHNDYTPDEVRLRKQIDALKDELAVATTDARVTFLVTAINAAVKHLNTLGTNAIGTPVAPVSLEVERRKLRERVGARADQIVQPIEPLLPATSIAPRSSGSRWCAHAKCKQRNDPAAHYCRRCGRKLVVAT